MNGKQIKEKKIFAENRYKSQCLKIGEIHCLFISCFRQGKSPLLSIGPSWPFTPIILIFAGMITTYFLCLIIYMGQNGNEVHLVICYIGVAINMLCLFVGILKNPGIPQKFIENRL